MNPAQAIALYQPTLQRIAYNLVRCKEDAEDIVQETLLKWLSAESTKIQNTKAYLIASVTNNCLRHLETLKRRKTECLEAINKTEFVHLFKENNFAHLDLEADLDKAFKLIHAKLEPLERAAYLLKEAFDVDYDALQEVFNKKKEHCRQLVCRARKKLEEEKAKIQLDLPDLGPLMASFRKSCEIGNPKDLIQELKKDISRSLSKNS
ncbi:MAG: RNA polymerase subunit sigma [Cyclobacteriaceae bacterium]|nr:RNA polymerase subunit sigma [Cyclobacteriaceae bacterium]